MSQHRDRSRKKTLSKRNRFIRFSARTITGQTWFTRLPRWVRVPVIVTMAVLIAFLATAALPALVYFALVEKPTARDDESKTLDVGAVMGIALVLLVVAFSSGASLIGVFRGGEFCLAPSRYVGLYCITPESEPLLFVTSFVLFWIIFWVCSMFVAASLRHLASLGKV